MMTLIYGTLFGMYLTLLIVALKLHKMGVLKK